MFSQSTRMIHVHSDIRGPLFVEALRMQAAGTPVLKLNTGNPASFGFSMPQSVRQALSAHMDDAVAYCGVHGMSDALSAIRQYHTSRGLQNVKEDDIFIGNGVSEMASMITTALLSDGDELLVPAPCYSLWSNSAYISGGKPVFYRCAPEDDWNPDLEDIERKITSRTKALLLINPNNPTGAVYKKEILLAIADIARRHKLILLSDEIYDRLLLPGVEYTSIAALAPDVPCVTFNGLSKSHIICGFRCGWMVFTGSDLEEIKAAVSSLAALRLCGNALTQLVISAALDDFASTKAMLVPGGRLYEQRAATLNGLTGIDGLTFVPNKAAFYLFPSIDAKQFDFESGYDFALKFLHEKQILVIPGTGFDWDEDLRFRIVMLPEPKLLTSAMNDLREFLDVHRI